VLSADWFVAEIYRTGFVQSLIVHVALLLVMAMIAIGPDIKPPPLKLVLDFTKASDATIDLEQQDWPSVEFVDSGDLEAESEKEAVAQLAALADDVDQSIDVEPVELVAFKAVERVEQVAPADLLAQVPSRMPRDRRNGRSAARGDQDFAEEGSGRRGQGQGIGGEMGRRLKAAGAKSGDVQISIAWNSTDDIDVHVLVQAQNGVSSSINWTSRMGLCGGMLDVDANANPSMLTRTPVENIFWQKGRAPYGRFTISIHHFRSWSGQMQTPVEVAVMVDGEVTRFSRVATVGGPIQFVTSFVRTAPPGRRTLADRNAVFPADAGSPDLLNDFIGAGRLQGLGQER